MIDLDERLDRAAHDLWAAVPTDSRTALASRRPRHGRMLVATAAAATLVIALGAVWAWRDVPADEPTTAASPSSATPQTTAPQTTLVPPTAVTTAVSGTGGLPAPGSILTSEVEYVIQEGDYPATVATMWGISFEDLATLNGWTLQENGIVPEWPGVGATIRIPAGARVPGGVDDTDALGVAVFEQSMQVTLTTDFTCDEPSTSPGFDTFNLSLFSDRASRRWLMRATFPDLSTYELVATGSVLYPTTLHERGTWQGVDTGCAVFGSQQVLGAMIGEGAIVALNLEDDLSDAERPFFAGDVDPAATRNGDRTSTTGWPGTGWTMTVTSVYTADDLAVRGIEQTTRWIVGVDGTVVERSFENRMEGLGASKVTTSMLGFGDTMIDAASFDTSDARPLVPHERPAIPDNAAGATVPDGAPSAVATCGTYTVVDGDVPAAVATKLATTFQALEAVNVDTPGWDQWFPGLVIDVPC